MAKDKISIRSSMESQKSGTGIHPDDKLYLPDKKIIEEKPVNTLEPLDENIWGNDAEINRALPKEYLDERRMYVRVRYMHSIECRTILRSPGHEPETLEEPIRFTTVDISMGGIGIICDHEIEIGLVLMFQLLLDNMPYMVEYKAVYCIPVDGKYRIGLKKVHKDKNFVKHLKIFVARISLLDKYGNRQDDTAAKEFDH